MTANEAAHAVAGFIAGLGAALVVAAVWSVLGEATTRGKQEDDRE